MKYTNSISYNFVKKIQALAQGGYTHPSTHPATIIVEDINHQFVTAAQKSNIENLSGFVNTNDERLSDARNPTPHGHLTDEVMGLDSALSGKEPANGNIQAHVISVHAPSNAQVNADITKAEIEAKLTGIISTHTHSGGADPFTAKLIVSGDKPTGANVTPVTLGVSFNYEANKTYVIDIYAIVAPTAATTGCGFLLDVSTAVTYVGTFSVHQLAATGTLSGGSSIGDKGATAMGVSSGMVGTGSNFVTGSMLLITGTNTGTAEFFFRSETTAVTTCKSGSAFRVMKLN
jgi:hypothetical protein